MRSTLIRLDTNQEIYGLGEVRDGASHIYALQLKRQLLGENPCNVDKVFRKSQTIWMARTAGRRRVRRGDGTDGFGGQSPRRTLLPTRGWKISRWHPHLLRHAFTPDPEEMGNSLKARMDSGFTFLKMDIGTRLLKGIGRRGVPSVRHVGNRADHAPVYRHPTHGQRHRCARSIRGGRARYCRL